MIDSDDENICIINMDDWEREDSDNDEEIESTNTENDDSKCNNFGKGYNNSFRDDYNSTKFDPNQPIPSIKSLS